MPHRLQFGLKSLLIATFAACLLLGGWSLLMTYGDQIEIVEPHIGKPIEIRTRHVKLFGPLTREIWVDLSDENGNMWRRMDPRVKRRFLCLYTCDCRFQPVEGPGRYSVILTEAGDGRFYTVKVAEFDLTE